MSRSFVFAGLGALLLVCSMAAPARAVKQCAYEMPVEMVDSLDSRTARSGGIFRFKVSEDAVSDDGIPIPKDTIGYGVIRAVDQAGRHAHDGSIAIEPRYLVVPKAKGGFIRIDVTMNPTMPPAWGPNEPLVQKAMGHVPIPVPGMVMSGINMVRYGRNITLGPGFHFSVIPMKTLQKGPIC
jgi:hypothetical protein